MEVTKTGVKSYKIGNSQQVFFHKLIRSKSIALILIQEQN